MPAIAFTEAGLLNAKRAVRETFPDEKSAHLTEAIAAACGYRTHAAALEAARRSNSVDPDFVLLKDEAFARRLCELSGTELAPDYAQDWLEYLPFPSKELAIRTESAKLHELDYKSDRAKAWRNLMVAGINVGIERRLFTIRPGDNRWPGVTSDPRVRSEGHVYRFSIGEIPAVAYVNDAGFEELSIHVTAWPSARGEHWIRAGNAGFEAGEAVAAGWLERQDGAWLQVGGRPLLVCRRHRLEALSSLSIRASCYADRGNFKM
jgi:hypothetical protein